MSPFTGLNEPTITMKNISVNTFSENNSFLLLTYQSFINKFLHNVFIFFRLIENIFSKLKYLL